jgi:TRAP-type transport system periplasmic protein
MNSNSIVKFSMAVLAAVALAATVVPATQAQEVTLRAVSAFAEGTGFSRDFESFVKKVNQEGKGLVRINYLGGGGKVMSPFEVGNAVKGGVVDIANVPGAFYTNLMPEADALKLTQRPMQELRQTGGWEYLNQLHNEKLNAYYLARVGDGIPFHLYLNKKIDKPDLTGLKIRVTPIYMAFVQKLGGIPIRTDPGEVYTALERGVVDGYGWPIQGVLDLGWQEVTKFRIDPGFYQVEVNTLVNLNKWNSLNEEQREFLKRMGAWLEEQNKANAEINRKEAEAQAAAGIQVITFSPEQNQEYLEKAYEAGWEKVIETSPSIGAKLRELFSK